jgi:hypothetical protein
MISIDLPLLRALYTIILSDFEKCKRKNIPITHTLYLPDFLSWLSGGDERINRLMIDTYTNKILDFQWILGIINGQPLPLMGEVKIDISKNTLCFSSPYMNALVQKVYTASIRKDKKTGEPKLSSSGQPLLKSSHSYLVKPSITKERNKKAVEIVTMIVVLIEQAGNRTAHIRASTIIERCPELQSALVKASTSNKNLLLRRTFSKVWELLNTQTILTLTYKNIHLPNEKSASWIPTTKSLDMVFTFPHEGKIKSASTQENII